MRGSEPDRIRETYDDFSAFYRELIEATGRVAAERSLLGRLFQKLCIPPDSPILDAACGTGDALAYLHERGFTNLHGMDASRGMLKRAMDLTPDIPFVQSRWDQLSADSFGVCSRFRLIYLLSLSLQHVQSSDLPKILALFRSLLQDGGQLVFDVRNWQRNRKGSLRELDRPIGQSQTICSIHVKNRTWHVTDQCCYTSERQVVEYTATATDNAHDRQCFKVSYALLTAEDFVQKLENAGFCEITRLRFKSWPYSVLVAESRRDV